MWGLFSFGQVENARKHLYVPGKQVDQSELNKLRLLEKHVKRCAEARKIGDWKSTLRESDAAIAVGADFSPQVHIQDFIILNISVILHSFCPLTWLSSTCSLLLVKLKPI